MENTNNNTNENNTEKLEDSSWTDILKELEIEYKAEEYKKNQDELNNTMEEYIGNSREGYIELEQNEEENIAINKQMVMCSNCIYRRNDGICRQLGVICEYLINIKCGDCWSYVGKV